MGITAATPTNLVVGAGNLLRASADLGASEDANAFRIERTYFTPDLNGSPGGLMGTDYVQSEEGILESSLPELSATTLGALWPGSADTGGGEIRFDGAVRLQPEAYADWELVVPGFANEFGFFCENAVNLGKIDIQADDKSTAKPRLELHSRWDPADLTVSPHGFRITALGS